MAVPLEEPKSTVTPTPDKPARVTPMATWRAFSSTLKVARTNCSEMSLSTMFSTALLNPRDAEPAGTDVTFRSIRFTV